MIYAVTHSGTACLDDYSLREISSDCEPNLSAIPNPAVRSPGAKQSRSSISWNSHSGAGAHVGLSINGQPETRFAEGPAGMRIFDIETGSRWEFRLYDGMSSAPVRTTAVTSETIPLLSASPVIFQSPSAPGKTTISWNMPNHSEAEVWVSHDGNPEQLFVRGASGSQDAPWIARGSTYEFIPKSPSFRCSGKWRIDEGQANAASTEDRIRLIQLLYNEAGLLPLRKSGQDIHR